MSSNLQHLMRTSPVTLSLILLACLATLAFSKIIGPQVLLWLAFTPIEIINLRLSSLPLNATLETGQWWRLITPIFLHFGITHLVFNCLWIWILGSQVELRQGSFKILALSLCTALVSNTAQFVVNESSNFGGLSGVVYGYLGYVWLTKRLRPQLGLELNNSLVIFMLVWMLFGISGLSAMLGLNMANEAHLGGLLAGLVFALVPWSGRPKRWA